MKCNHSSLTKGCKDCSKLQKEWNVRLEKTVPNIEQEDGNLKQWHSFHFARKKHTLQNGGQSSKEEYYRLAGHFLYENEFLTERDRRIWELHADGKQHRQITDTLAKQGFKVKIGIVSEAVRRLTKEMLGKLWNN